MASQREPLIAYAALLILPPASVSTSIEQTLDRRKVRMRRNGESHDGVPSCAFAGHAEQTEDLEHRCLITAQLAVVVWNHSDSAVATPLQGLDVGGPFALGSRNCSNDVSFGNAPSKPRSVIELEVSVAELPCPYSFGAHCWPACVVDFKGKDDVDQVRRSAAHHSIVPDRASWRAYVPIHG